MKEIVKSKAMIGFLIFVVGFFYLNAVDIKKMDESKDISTHAYVAVNS